VKTLRISRETALTKGLNNSHNIKKDKEIIVTIKDRGTMRLAINKHTDPRELMI